MHHLETWPHLYKPGETYLNYDWDLGNFIPILTAYLDDKERLEKIAMNSQACCTNVSSQCQPQLVIPIIPKYGAATLKASLQTITQKFANFCYVGNESNYGCRT